MSSPLPSAVIYVPLQWQIKVDDDDDDDDDDSAKRVGILRWLQPLPSVRDVVSLQETHCTALAEGQPWFQCSGFECSLSPGTARSACCIVFFRPPLSLEASWTDSDGRFLR